MASNDVRTPLLGHNVGAQTTSTNTNRFRRLVGSICNKNFWRRRIPIIKWLPQYTLSFLLHDIIAGITVGLTSIPQGIAYAIIAGLPPQWGLYSSMLPGFVYMVFGSCKDVTVGPTAILAALVSKYVAYSTDFAILAAFLSGCIILLLGVLRLGFLLDFISVSVITGFTTAAALQISASQLHALFRTSASGGGTFVGEIISFFQHINTVKLWDPILGFTSIIFLLILKKATVSNENTRWCAKVWQTVVRARNAVVVALGATLAYCLQYYGNITPFALTGKVEGGLPHFAPPPFSTVVKNQTYNFGDMLNVFGAEGLVMPLVAILESIAIAKAFAGCALVDASQELVAVGLCNAAGAWGRVLPVAGSFTRTALNHASGVRTPAGGLFKGLLVLLSVSLLAPAFAWIPRATLAAIIIVAMFSIISVRHVPLLYQHSRWELYVYVVTLLSGACAGLEYGILAGAAADVCRVLYAAARPAVMIKLFQGEERSCVMVMLFERLYYCSAQRICDEIMEKMDQADHEFMLMDWGNLPKMDASVAENLVAVINELERRGHRIIMLKVSPGVQQMLEDFDPNIVDKIVNLANFTPDTIHTLFSNTHTHR